MKIGRCYRNWISAAQRGDNNGEEGAALRPRSGTALSHLPELWAHILKGKRRTPNSYRSNNRGPIPGCLVGGISPFSASLKSQLWNDSIQAELKPQLDYECYRATSPLSVLPLAVISFHFSGPFTPWTTCAVRVGIYSAENALLRLPYCLWINCIVVLWHLFKIPFWVGKVRILRSFARQTEYLLIVGLIFCERALTTDILRADFLMG